MLFRSLPITAIGIGFTTASGLSLNTATAQYPIAATYVSSTTLTGTIPAAALAATGSAAVQVTDSFYTGNVWLQFTITPAAPTITSLSPASIVAGSAGFSLTVNGSGFLPGAAVQWNAASLTTFYSATQLVATVPSSWLTTPGTVIIRAANPGPVPSNSLTFTVAAPPVPAITTVTPSEVDSGPGFTLAVTGSNFISGSTVYWKSTPLTTTWLGLTQLSATVPSSLAATEGINPVVVINPYGSTSNDLYVLVDPDLLSISPSSVTAGSAGFTLTATGSGLTPTDYLWFSLNGNSTNLPTTHVNASTLTATVPASLIVSPGSAWVRIRDTDGSASRVTLTLNVYSPNPTLTLVNPYEGFAGSATTLTLTGYSLASGCTATWGSTPLATTFINSTSVQVTVPGALTALSGVFNLQVKNPDGSTSNAWPFPVLPSGLRISPSTIPAGSPDLAVTITGIGFTHASGLAVARSGTLTAVPSTYVNSNTLTATVPAAFLTVAGLVKLQITDSFNTNDAWVELSLLGGPILTSLSPLSIDAGSDTFTLSVNGTGFYDGAVVQWNGTPLATIWGGNVLAATVPASFVAAPGTATITATNLNTGLSNALSFTITRPPAPTITAATTPPVNCGVAFALIVTGTNFVSGSTVYLASTPLVTTKLGYSQLSGAVPASLVALSGIYPVQVINPYGSASNTASINILPNLLSISPSSVPVGSAAFTLTATGSGFTPADYLWLNVTGNPQNLATAFVNSSTLTATMPASLLLSAFSGWIRVNDTSGIASGASLTFSVVSTNPVVTSLNPASATAGGVGFTLTVNGTGFVPGDVVQWNSSPLSTTFVSATQLSSLVPASLIATAGTANITAIDPGGMISSVVPFGISTALPPWVSTAGPNQLDAGGPAFTLVISGGSFVAGSTAYWNSTALPTTFTSGSQLNAAVPSSLILISGRFNIMVQNPGGVVSSAWSQMYIQPVLNAISPNSSPTGSSNVTVTATGIGFTQSDALLVNANGTQFALPTTFISSTTLAAQLPATALSSVGSVSVMVSDIAAGTSSRSQLFTIKAAATVTPVITSLSPASATAGGPSFTLTVNGSGFSSGANIAWNGSALPTAVAGAAQLSAVVPANLIAAAGSASVAVINSDGTNSAPATFSITPILPVTSKAWIVNAASSLPSIAPGSLISIYGANLATTTTQAVAPPFPPTLGGSWVTINGANIPLLFVSPGQINAQIPYETKPGTATLVVQSNGLLSAPVDFTVTPTGPGVMVVPPANHALVWNIEEASLNSAQTPTKPGEYITAYVIGQGLVDNPVATGAAAPSSPYSLPLAAVQATIGGQPAVIQFAGLAPGYVGLMQLNLHVPDVPAGELALEVTIGGVAANSTVISVGSQ